MIQFRLAGAAISMPRPTSDDDSDKASSWRTLRNVAEALRLQSLLLEAESLYLRALQSAVILHGEESAAAGLIFLDLADLYQQIGHLDQCETMYARAITILRNRARLEPDLLNSRLT